MQFSLSIMKLWVNAGYRIMPILLASIMLSDLLVVCFSRARDMMT